MDNYNEVQDVIRSNGKAGRVSHEGIQQDEPEDLTRQSLHIQELIQDIDDLPDARTREMVQECVQEILSFYGQGLKRILEVISKGKSDAAKDIYNDLIEDSFVSGLLLIHDLHPLDLKTRLHQALEKLKPYMDSHGGSVEIVSVEDGIAKLKLSGSCKGCPSSTSTLELGIKQAIEESCPDLLGLEVEGMLSEDNKISINGNAKPGSQGWKPVGNVGNLRNSEMKMIDVQGASVVVCKVSDTWYAYQNNCPACNMPLSTGILEGGLISCKLGHRYDVQKAGKCTDDEILHLNPIPLIEQDGVLKIAVE
jgi:Fe-S cluster biogenesis protein NfuA/nitrite reductase/ring-hydroxylating ferredoxin subunit